ncbi:MAG: preprotein translocase subunit YajC [Muribaculaceae bacterium]|nr:preprotein translocase subunit YajC [Muribaculaceae bacterium]
MLNSILLFAGGAAQQGGAQQGNGWGSLIMIVALIAIFYLFMIRPQSQRQKKVRDFQKSLKPGLKVMTAGGIHGKIRKVSDTTVQLEVDKNVCIVIEKGMVYESYSQVAEVGADPQTIENAK